MGVESKILEEEFDKDYEPTEEEIVEYAQFLGMNIDTEQDLFWIPRESLKAPLPVEWKPCQTADGNVYYFNFKTGESMWDHPCDEYYRTMYQEEKLKKENTAPGSKKSEIPKTVVSDPKPIVKVATPSDLAKKDIPPKISPIEQSLDKKELKPILKPVGSIVPLTGGLAPIKGKVTIIEKEKSIDDWDAIESIDAEAKPSKTVAGAPKTTATLISTSNNLKTISSPFKPTAVSKSKDDMFDLSETSSLEEILQTKQPNASKQGATPFLQANVLASRTLPSLSLAPLKGPSLAPLSPLALSPLTSSSKLSKPLSTTPLASTPLTTEAPFKNETKDIDDFDNSDSEILPAKILSTKLALNPLKSEIKPFNNSDEDSKISTNLKLDQSHERQLLIQKESLVTSYSNKLALLQEQLEKDYQMKMEQTCISFSESMSKLHSEGVEALVLETSLLKNKIVVEMYSDGPVLKMPSVVPTDHRSISSTLAILRLKFENKLMDEYKAIKAQYSEREKITKECWRQEFEIESGRKRELIFEGLLVEMKESHAKSIETLTNSQQSEYNTFQQKSQLKLAQLKNQIDQEVEDKEESRRNFEIDMVEKMAKEQLDWDSKIRNISKISQQRYEETAQSQSQSSVIIASSSSEDKEKEIRNLEWESTLRKRQTALATKEIGLAEREKKSKDNDILQKEKASLTQDIEELEKRKVRLDEQIRMTQLEREQVLQYSAPLAHLKERNYDLPRSQPPPVSFPSSKPTIMRKSHDSIAEEKEDSDSSDLESEIASEDGYKSSMRELTARIRDEERNLKKAKKFLSAQRREIEAEHHLAGLIDSNSSKKEREHVFFDTQDTLSSDIENEAPRSTSPKKGASVSNFQSERIIAEVRETATKSKSLNDGMKTLDTQRGSLDDIERDLNALLLVLNDERKKTAKYSPTTNARPLKSTLVSDSLYKPRNNHETLEERIQIGLIGMPGSYLARFEKTRENGWNACQKRSEAILGEHQEWLKNFTITSRQ